MFDFDDLDNADQKAAAAPSPTSPTTVSAAAPVTFSVEAQPVTVQSAVTSSAAFKQGAPVVTYSVPLPVAPVTYAVPASAAQVELPQTAVTYTVPSGTPTVATYTTTEAVAAPAVVAMPSGPPGGPNRFTISPELFEKLTRGESVAPEELEQFHGGPAQVAAVGEPEVVVDTDAPAATTTETVSGKKKAKKYKGLAKVSKKTRGCC
jgi:hypothetical protein